jgi:uncharacterized membrane protein (UPF0127 family)
MAKLTVEVADTPASLAHGLMYRKDLPNNEGMLFKFPNTRELSFWGQNTYIPLDIAFIDKDNKIAEIKQITPMSTRMVRSTGFCSMALEANAGYFDSNGITVGQKISIDDNTIEFKEC